MAEKNDSSFDTEFEEFLNLEEGIVPPSDVSNRILSTVHSDLNPPAINVFGKTSLIHFVIGGATLLFCPQFGFSVTSSMGLMPYLMRYGDGVCMLGCGALFTSLSLLATSFVLRPEEVRVLERNRVVQVAALSTLSLGALLCFGSSIVLTLGLVWFLGALLGGIASLELGWFIRRRQFVII
jgi:hypothetical protein